MSDIKLKVLPLFPSQTFTRQGIRLDVSNSRYTFSLDHGSLNVEGGYLPGDDFLLFDGSNYFRVPVTSVIPTIITTPSPLTAFDNATIGTVVGTLSVIGGTGTYTYSLTSNPGGKYSIVGNQLKTATLLTSGVDTITIQAYNGIGQPHTLTTTVTVAHVHVGYAPTYHIYGF
jgi:hypothetical protein